MLPACEPVACEAKEDGLAAGEEVLEEAAATGAMADVLAVALALLAAEADVDEAAASDAAGAAAAAAVLAAGTAAAKLDPDGSQRSSRTSRHGLVLRGARAGRRTGRFLPQTFSAH